MTPTPVPSPEARPPRRARARRAALLAVLALLPLACGHTGGTEEPPYSVLLVTLDTTRADALTPYGNRPEITPNLQALSKTSLVYERAHTVAPVTLPSHSSMMTGLYPPRHTVRDNGLWALPDSADTLAEEAKKHGFRTAAFIGAVVLDASFGLAQGFDLYDQPRDDWSDGTTHYDERPGNEVVDDALQWLQGVGADQRFFLWVHLFDAHGPHEPPEGYRSGVFAKNPYHGEVAFDDAQVGRLLAALRASGRMDRTYIAVVADHGEAFGENGEWSHGAYAYESTMHVPMILRDPSGARAGKRSRENVSVVDLYPTLCEAMGFAASSFVDGTSLFRKQVPADRGVYLESYVGYLSFGWSPLAGWLQDGRKYLVSSQPELYDLGVDAGEQRNLYSVRKDEVREYEQGIAGVYDRPALQRDASRTADPEVLKGIQGLGYVAAAGKSADLPNPLLPSKRPSPASMRAVHQLTLQGMTLNNTGHVKEAEKLFRKALDGHPENHFARNLLAFCLMRQKREAEAIPLLEEVIEKGPQWPDTYSNLGICLANLGRLPEAEKAFRGALAIDPDKPEALFGLSQVLKNLGRPDEAAPYRERWEKLRGGN